MTDNGRGRLLFEKPVYLERCRQAGPTNGSVTMGGGTRRDMVRAGEANGAEISIVQGRHSF
jgi:hypothetical protein